MLREGESLKPQESEHLLAWELPLVRQKLKEKDYYTLIKEGKLYSIEDKAVALLYKASQYDHHEFWKADPPIENLKEQEEYFKAFKWFLKKYNLKPTFVEKGLKRVQLILIHAFIPRKHVREFLELTYRLYNKFNREGEDPFSILSLENRELKAIITEELKKINTIRTYMYILDYEITLNKVKNVLYTIFALWRGEEIAHSLPDWFVVEIYRFKREKESSAGREILRRTSLYEEEGRLKLTKSFKKQSPDFAFFDFKYRRINYKIEESTIILPKPPYYVVINQGIKTTLTRFTRLEDEPYYIFVTHERILREEKIGNYSIYFYSEGTEFISIGGVEVPFIKPLETGAKVFYDKFYIKLNKPEFVHIYISTPSGEYLSSENISSYKELTQEGRYEIVYDIVYENGNRRSFEKVVYIFKEKPLLNFKDLTVTYKGKEYSMEKEKEIVIEEFSEKFKASISYIEKTENISNSILEIHIANSKIINGLFIRLFNKCGLMIENNIIVGSSSKISITLDNYPQEFISFPLRIQLILKYKNRKFFLDEKEIDGTNTTPCPSYYVWINALNVTLGGKPNVKYKFELAANIAYIKPKERKSLKRIFGVENGEEVLNKLEEILNNPKSVQRNFLKKIISDTDILKIIDRHFIIKEGRK